MSVEAKSIRRIKTGIIVAVCLFAVASAAALVLTWGPGTLEALSRASLPWLFVAFLVWAAYLGVDSVRTWALARTLGERLPLYTALDIIASGMFLAVVTPFQVSGLPYQLWIMKKDGDVEPGVGMSVIVLRGLLIYLFVFTVAPLGMALFGVEAGGFFRVVLVYFGVIGGLFISVFLLSLLAPGLVARLARRGRLARWAGGFLEQTLKMRSALVELFAARRPGWLALTLGLSVLSLALYWSVVPVILFALGQGWQPRAFFLQAMLQGALLYSPTPGAAGIAEGAGAAVFGQVCQPELLGVFLVLWRAGTVYLTALAGAITFFRRMWREATK